MNLHTGKKARRKLTSAVLAAALLVSGLPLTAYAGDTWPFTGDSAPGANQPNVHGYTSSHIANHLLQPKLTQHLAQIHR